MVRVMLCLSHRLSPCRVVFDFVCLQGFQNLLNIFMGDDGGATRNQGALCKY